MRFIGISHILVICVAMLYLASETRADSHVLHPDLAFNFVCGHRDRSSLERKFELFLQHKSFKVLNQGKIQREHQVFLLDTHVIGLDDERRMIEVTAFPNAKDAYSVGLNTPPPTRRVSQLEESLLTFVSAELGCDVSAVTRGENGVDASKFYDNQVERIENLFREAEELRDNRRL